MKTIVIDIGGTSIKIWNADGTDSVICPSGTKLTPQRLVSHVKAVIERWPFDRISIGYAGHVVNGRPVADPINLAPGWVTFDWSTAFNCPLRIINDACMQALGSYEGGSMLYLGLGTGIGTAYIFDGVIIPLALGHLLLGKKSTIDERVNRQGRKRLGIKRWRKACLEIGRNLKDAFFADYVVFGGGNAQNLGKLPAGFRMGGNQNAYLGGLRIWEDIPTTSGYARLSTSNCSISSITPSP